MRLVTGASVLALAGGMLAVAAGPAAAAATPHRASTPAYDPDQYGEILNWNSDLCLGIAEDQSHTPAVQKSCNGTSDQIWNRGKENPNFPGWFQYVNNAGQCLGVAGGSLAQGARLVGWTCLGPSHPDQYWGDNFGTPPAPCGPDPEGYSPIENLNSSLVIGVSANSSASGAAIVQWSYQDTCNNQQWI
jgi:hypothetical protein